MSLTDFAMVEELAFLVKDNLPSKHLVLSIEEALIEFLHNEASQDGVLKLEPMSSYNRLLLHRLADIFGFAHVSVGEGDDRHLILERCPESSIPPVLVSDILWEYDAYECPPTSHQLLRRKEATPALKTTPISIRSSLEEREAAYLAARDRIFSEDNNVIKESVTPKPRNIPVAARRMIAHALGQSIHSNSPGKKASFQNEQIEGLGARENNKSHLSGSTRSQELTPISSRKVQSEERRMRGCSECSKSFSSTPSERKVEKKAVKERSCNRGAVQSGSSVRVVRDDNLKQENIGNVHSGSSVRVVREDSLKRENVGAAKRIFAHALGLQGAKGGNGFLLKLNEVKAVDKARV